MKPNLLACNSSLEDGRSHDSHDQIRQLVDRHAVSAPRLRHQGTDRRSVDKRRTGSIALRRIHKRAAPVSPFLPYTDIVKAVKNEGTFAVLFNPLPLTTDSEEPR